MSLATWKLLQIDALRLEPILGTTKQSRFSGRGDVSRPPGGGDDLQDRDSFRGINAPSAAQESSSDERQEKRRNIPVSRMSGRARLPRGVLPLRRLFQKR